MKIIPVSADCQPMAEALREQLGIQEQGEETVALMVSDQGCFLRRLIEPFIEWHIDFLSADYQQAFAGRGRHKDPLARAIGLNKRADLHVLDMTAGFGKDALWLAYCGAQVTLIERHPVLAYLLQQAIDKMALDSVGADVAARMHLICAQAQDVLMGLSPGAYDVAYYDPMFDQRKKSALVKKDMQLLQALHGEETPDPELIQVAKQKIGKVVVKRAKLDALLLPGVHHQISTKVTRFDVYQ